MTTHSRHAFWPLAPLGALAATGLGIVWSVAMGRLPDGPVAVAAVAGFVGSAAWISSAVFRRVRRPRRDRDAHERLELLRDRTCLPDVTLVAVIGTEWASHGGQAASIVDVRTGLAGTQWFPLACFPPGSLILCCPGATGLQVLDWMPPAEVQAAHRHQAGRAHHGRRPPSTRSWAHSSPRRLHAEIQHALRVSTERTKRGLTQARVVPRRVPPSGQNLSAQPPRRPEDSPGIAGFARIHRCREELMSPFRGPRGTR